jgi:monoamine oxidase
MTTTRRGFLAGAASLAVTPRLRAAGADLDVAIVGAGAAGLAAAKALRRAGRNCVLLEARSRIGGRAFTDRSLGLSFDAGAQYIHWAERNPWRRIAQEMGAELADEAGGGRRASSATARRSPKRSAPAGAAPSASSGGS